MRKLTWQAVRGTRMTAVAGGKTEQSFKAITTYPVYVFVLLKAGNQVIEH